MNDAEEYIKRELDGTFTKVRVFDGKVITETVPLDYIPDHSPSLPPANVGKRGPGRAARHVWSEDDDQELQRLRRLGWSKMRCAHAFNCSEEAVRRRLRHLRECLRGEQE